MKYKLIAFSGLDGSGKSTQIDLLSEYLATKGKKVKVIWSRGGYTPGFNFFKKVLRKIFKKKMPKPGRNHERAKKLEKPIIAKLWLSIAVMDLILLYSIYFRFLIVLNYIVIADRYLHDTLIDFKLNFPNINFEKWLLWKALWILSPKAKNVYLDISLDEALNRLKNKDEPFPDSEEVLSRRLQYYRSFYTKQNSVFLDATKNIGDIQKQMVELLSED